MNTYIVTVPHLRAVEVFEKDYFVKKAEREGYDDLQDFLDDQHTYHEVEGEQGLIELRNEYRTGHYSQHKLHEVIAAITEELQHLGVEPRD